MKLIVYLILLLLSNTACLAQQTLQGGKPLVVGSIYTIQSKILKEERTLNVYLPYNYNPLDSIKYPIIYLLDGSTDEDFFHIAGLVQFYSSEWVNLVPKSILVGIATIDRKRDFTFPSTLEEENRMFPTAGHSDRFIQFIATELQPFIDKNFKTNNSKTIIGQSLGGLLATEILLTKPSLFDKYIIVSPSLWWDNGSLLLHDFKSLTDLITNQKMIYVGVGKEGLAPGRTKRVMEVDANVLVEQLKTLGCPRLQVVFDYMPDENHATVMHQAVEKAFKSIKKVDNQQ